LADKLEFGEGGEVSELLVTTSRSFLLLNPLNGEAKVIDSGRGLYYGIAFSKESIFVAARRNEDCFEYVDQRGEEEGVILVYDDRLRFTQELHAPFPLRDIHQIMFFDNRLWVTCAWDDMIAIHDCTGWRQWRPFEDSDATGKDLHHLNSLWADEGSLYVLAHKHGPSEIWQFDHPSLRPLGKTVLGNHAHNIWRKNGDLFTCNSRFGTVESVRGFRLEVGGFTRGAVVTETFCAVGVSEIAGRGRRHAHSVKGWIYLYEPGWSFSRAVELEGEGQILDVRVLGEDDYCSPQGLFPCVKRSRSPVRHFRVLAGADELPDLKNSPRLYRLDAFLDFRAGGNGMPYMDESWSAPEPWGTWTCAREACLSLRIAPKPTEDLLLSVFLQPFVNRANPCLTVTVSVNGESVGEWIFLDGTRLTEALMPIPFSCLSKLETTHISFIMDAPKSPSELGLSADTRKLGIGVVSLSLSPMGKAGDPSMSTRNSSRADIRNRRHPAPR
jgi:hypothetical protein